MAKAGIMPSVSLKPSVVASINPPSRIEPEVWARKTANRLRLIHASFSDQGEDQRRLHLEDEIDFALEEAGAATDAEKRKLMMRLGACFPVFSDSGEGGQDGVAENHTAHDPVSSFVAHYKSVDAAEQVRIQAMLEDEGVVSASGSDANSRISSLLKLPEKAEELDDLERGLQQVWKELGVDPSMATAMDFNRAIKLLGMLSASTRDLHRFLWEFWRQTAARDLQATWRSHFNEPFDGVIARYLDGGDETGSRDIAMEIERTKRLMLGVCFAVRRGAEEFGRNQHQIFAPENIENAVAIEETTSDHVRVKDMSRKSWEKYKQLCRHMTPESIDSDFNRVFSSVITGWLRSRG